jgi:metal-responsive CopG/Arc/MetJ family transcriptional regulator
MKKSAPSKGKTEGGRITKARVTAAIRTSVSFPRDLHKTLEDLAKQKKVSLAWIVRDAAEKYVASQQSQSGKH